MELNKLIRESFRNHHDGVTLIEFATNIEIWATSTTMLYERWKRPNKGSMKELKVRSRTYHYEKATENSKFGPEWVLHGKRGARYGLFRGINDEYIPLNLKTRRVVAKAGTFKATESGLMWSRDLSMLDKIITGVNEEILRNKCRNMAIKDMVRRKFNEGVVLNELNIGNRKQAEDILNDPKSSPEDKKLAQDFIDKTPTKDGEQKKDDDIEFEKTGDGVEDVDGEAGQIDDTQNDIETLESTGLQISDDGKSLTDADGKPVEFKTGRNGVILVDGEPLDLQVGPDGTIKEVDPEEANKEAETQTKSEDITPEQKTDIEIINKKLPKYIMAKDPEASSKMLKSIGGGLTGALTWAMKAENEKGGSAFESFVTKVADSYKKMTDNIKNGKAQASELNKLVAQSSVKMKAAVDSYLSAKSKSEKELGPQIFNKAMTDTERRKKFYQNKGHIEKTVDSINTGTNNLGIALVLHELIKTNISVKIKKEIQDKLKEMDGKKPKEKQSIINRWMTQKNRNLTAEFRKHIENNTDINELARDIEKVVNKSGGIK